MAAAEASEKNNNPPIEFCSPLWFADYTRTERLPGEICWHHDEICEMVERDMRLLRPQTTEEEEEEEMRKKKANDYEKRNTKIREYLKKKEEEVERNNKRTRSSERLKERSEHLEEELERTYKRTRRSERLKEKELMIENEEKELIIENEIKNEALMIENKIENEAHERLANYLTEKNNDLRRRWSACRERILNNMTVKKWTFVKDGKYDISYLLSGGTRRTDLHCLIYNNGLQVSIERLIGKYVLLYFLSLANNPGQYNHRADPNFQGDLQEIYNIYNPQGDFEVVFVALGNNKDLFRDSFSHMPWLAIPHEDQEARDFFEMQFSIPYLYSQKAVLFAPDGTLLHDNAVSVFCTYGSQAFPFTNEKIQDMSYECDALQTLLFLKKQKPSLTALLGNNVISSVGHKVPTSKLDGKIVGLYFFEPTFYGFEQASQLLEVWKSLKDEQRSAFEIVFINKDPCNLSYAKEVFKNEFQYAIPWYSPTVCGRKLCWVFEKGSGKVTDLAGDFIVLEPDRYQPLSYFAFRILETFGADAYPFTLQRAVELARSKQQNELVLGELLSPEAPLRRGGAACYKEDTTVSKLLGKRVLLLFATHSCYESGSFLPELKRIYEQKGTHDNFEIIYISLDCDESPSFFDRSIQGMPWLVHAFVPDFALSLAKRVFYLFPPHLPAIAAFGPDGHLETKESNLAFKIDCNLKYPFIRADMDEEVHMELINLYKWDLERLDISDKYGSD